MAEAVAIIHLKPDAQSGFEEIEEHYRASQESEELLCCYLRRLWRGLLEVVSTTEATHKQIGTNSFRFRAKAKALMSDYSSNLCAGFEVFHDAVKVLFGGSWLGVGCS